MKKLDYYNFWNNFFPDIDDFKIVEDIYLEIFNTDLSEDTFNMIDEFEKNVAINLKNEDTVFYLNYKNNFKYSNEYRYFRKNSMYYTFYKPYINYLIEQLLLLSKYLSKINVELLFESLEVGLLSILAPISGRVLIRETEIKRRKNELIGNDKRERFLYFNNFLNNDKYILNLFYKYPVLFNILREKTLSYVSFIIEALKNIEKDCDEIKDKLNVDMLEESLIDIYTGAGDEHNDGKSVIILVFENNKKILYKPRNLKLDYNFNELLKWLSNKGLTLDLKDIKVIDKGNYGYVEFVNNSSCDSEELIKKYYIRSGYLLSLIYSLNGSDIHYENIIANGEYPIIIDLETLFNPKVDLNELTDDGENFAIEKIYESVLTIGMLPLMFRSNNIEAEYGGFGVNEEQLSPFKSYDIKNRECDDISVEWANKTIGTQKNNPLLNSKKVNSNNYINEIAYGFVEMYELILNNREAYKEVVKELFNSIDVRVLLRSTMEYSSLLDVSYHPDVLMDKLTRKVLLCRIYLEEEKNNNIKLIEYKSLLKGDIPYFSMKTNQCKLYSGGNIVNKKIISTPINYFFEKVDKMCEKDMKLQCKFIYKAYCNRKQEYDLDRTKFDFNKINNCNKYEINYKELLNSIAKYIIDESIIYDNKCERYRIWIGTTFNEDEKGYTDINYVGQDLYAGQAGIALFLMYYGKISKNKSYYIYAKEALTPCIKFIENVDIEHPFTVGAFAGIGGRFYAIYNLYSITKDNSLKNCILKYLELFKNIIEKDKLYDIVSGTSGLLHILLSLLKICDEKEILDNLLICIDKCEKHLTSNIKLIDKKYMTWNMSFEEQEKTYTGFGHGNSGIISALARYSKLFFFFFSEIIGKVLNYEDSLFDEKSNNWFRDCDRDMISLGWCHGAPGILLNKLILIENGLEELVDKEKLKIAIDTTIRKSFGNNPSLCHGDLGNLEIIYLASKVLNNKTLEKKSEAGFKWIIENVIKNRWKGSSYRGTDNFGLMIGISGFGYSIMKFNNFDEIPSILYFS